MRKLVLGLMGLILLVVSEVLLAARYQQEPLSLIAFVADNQIMIMQPDGRQSRVVVAPGGILTNLDWWDTNLIYIADGRRQGHLYAIHPTGAGKRRLVADENPLSMATLSQNRVAYVVDSPPLVVIEALDSQDSNFLQTVLIAESDVPPLTWLDEDTLLCVCADGLQRSTLSGNTEVLIQQPVQHMTLGPHHDELVFTEDTQLHHLDLGSDNAQLLAVLPGRLTWPRWSPTGEWIAFVEHQPRDYYVGSSEIHLIRPNGTDLQQLTEFFEITAPPTWSPDGRWLAFVSSHAGLSALYRVEVASGIVQRLTSTDAYYRDPVWSDTIERDHHAGLLFVLGSVLFVAVGISGVK